jgi:hypothetical protein
MSNYTFIVLKCFQYKHNFKFLYIFIQELLKMKLKCENWMDIDKTYVLRDAYIFICCDKCCNFVHRMLELSFV